MKLLALILLLGSDPFCKVSIKREAQDMYSFTSSSQHGIIQTINCYEYPYDDVAVLKYDKYSSNNKLMFASGNVCQVKDVFVK